MLPQGEDNGAVSLTWSPTSLRIDCSWSKRAFRRAMWIGTRVLQPWPSRSPNLTFAVILSMGLRKLNCIEFEHWLLGPVEVKDQIHCSFRSSRCSHSGVARIWIPMRRVQSVDWASHWTPLTTQLHFHSFSSISCYIHVSCINCYETAKLENKTSP
jgi:hypothetical protein